MKEKTYSREIANVVNTFLTENDWRFSFDENRGIFNFGLSLKGKLKKIDCIVDVKDNEYIVYAVSPIGVDENNPQMMAAMAEFICRANYGLKAGNFEFDYDDGEVRFKIHVCCEYIVPTAAMVKKNIYCSASMFEHYGGGILDIIFNEASGRSAVEKCENDNESKLCSILTELLGDTGEEPAEYEDMEEMAVRLAAHLGITEDIETAPTADDEENIEIHTDLFDNKGGTIA